MAKSKKDNEPAPPVDDNARFETTRENQLKAGKWFTRSRELADKRQYDYAIEYYVNGLEFWPDAVEDALKALHGCAVARRHAGGGKPGFKDTLKRSMNDKNAMQAFLNAVWLFGHDSENNGFIEGMVRNACRLRADDAAMWAGGVYLKALEGTPKASAKQFQAFVGHIEELGDRAAARDESEFALSAYQMGIDTLALSRRRFPKDETIDNRIRDLSTKLTILKGKYQKAESFRDSLSDEEEQKDLHDLERTVQDTDRVEELITKAQEDYEQNPDDHRTLTNLVELLCRRESTEDETRAIGFLVEAYKRTKAYRWKQRAEDIRIKQLNRKSRVLAKEGDPQAIKTHAASRLKFELGVFRERVDQYPTDLRVKFEYGVRLFKAGKYDDAIPLFQGARSDPKNRAACGLYLGRCFFRKDYFDQAIPTLTETIEGYDDAEGDVGKMLHYWLGRCEEASGDVESARKTYGKILQMDYNYKDVRARLDGLPEEG